MVFPLLTRGVLEQFGDVRTLCQILFVLLLRDDVKSQGWLLGKKLISGLKDFKPSFLDREKEFEDFIIGVDENGKEILHTCNPEKLADYFGKNPSAPHF